jgi:hypothetical protein
MKNKVTVFNGFAKLACPVASVTYEDGKKKRSRPKHHHRHRLGRPAHPGFGTACA